MAPENGRLHEAFIAAATVVDSITKSNRRVTRLTKAQDPAMSRHRELSEPRNLGHNADGAFRATTPLACTAAIISKLAAPGRPKGVSDVDACLKVGCKL